jgi:hypothetical protein
MIKDDVVGLVCEDVSRLAPSFTAVADEEGDGLQVLDAFQSEKGTWAVQWDFRCKHIGDFLGIRPTDRVLTIKGVTLVYSSHTFRRYVDWSYVSSQLGIASSMQPLVEDLAGYSPTPP